MADRAERKNQAAQHNALMKGAFASETAATVEATVIYEEGEGRTLDLPEAPFDATETIVTTAFAPEALYRFGAGKTAVVDPAAFTRPGGAYLDGAFGPEQILCSQSDRAAYLPDVAFSRGGTVRKANVIAIAEPLRARALENHRSERECDNALAQRITALLSIAAANECETLVVGAFGCGRLGYPADQVISLFREWIDAHPGAIARIVFAVPRAHVDAFDAAFGKPKEEEPAPAVQTAEDEEDAEDWRTVDLPEGITLR